MPIYRTHTPLLYMHMNGEGQQGVLYSSRHMIWGCISIKYGHLKLFLWKIDRISHVDVALSATSSTYGQICGMSKGLHQDK